MTKKKLEQELVALQSELLEKDKKMYQLQQTHLGVDKLHFFVFLEVVEEFALKVNSNEQGLGLVSQEAAQERESKLFRLTKELQSLFTPGS